MIKKYVIWQKVKNDAYQRVKYSEGTMATLSLFLEDGLGFNTYINFLENKNEDSFCGNMSTILKKEKTATVYMHEYIFPDLPPFITTIENLITIIKEFERLESLTTNTIKIILENDILTISDT